MVTPTGQKCRSIRAPLVIEGAPSVFVPIRVHSWFVFISKTKTAGFLLCMIRPVVDYPEHPVRARRQTGVSQRGQAGFQRSRPPDTPPPHHRDDTPGSAGVPPACCPVGCRSVSLRCCSRPPCRREPHGPGRSRGRAPLPVDSGEGDGRSCERICAGGTPALPGGLPPMTGSHQRDKSAEAFWRRLPLKEVHPSSGLFVLIRVHSWFVLRSAVFPRMIRTAGRGPDLPEINHQE